MSISHEISKDRVINVLQSIALKQQTGRLSIEHVGDSGKEKGEIFFVGGDTVFACTIQQSGETALDHILNWKVVNYSFVEGTPASAPTPTPMPTSRRGRFLPHVPQTNPLLPIEMQKTLEVPVIRKLSPPDSIGQGQQTSAIPLRTTSAATEPIRQTPAIGMPAIPKSVRPIKRSIPATPSPSHSFEDISSVREVQNVPVAPSQSQVAQVAGSAENIHQLEVNAVFKPRPIATTREVIYRTERRDRIVLLLLDGRRTLREVAQLIHRSEIDVARVLLRLLKQEYIEYCEFGGFIGR